MELYIVFGLPGAGKTFVGEIMQKYFDFYTFEADKVMPDALQEAIRKQTIVNDSLRNIFFDKLITEIKNLQTTHDKLAVTQVFIKEKYRKQILEHFPEAKFIFIEASDTLREERLQGQTTWDLDVEYWRKMSEIFEKPQIEHVTISNNAPGEENVKKQLENILN